MHPGMPPPHDGGMPTLNLSSGTVHYTDTGHGRPLMLLHANPGAVRDFDAVIPALAASHRVIALDWPGYGQSAMPAQPQTRGPRYFYDVLVEFLDALKLPPAIFIGNSLGGNAAARLAAQQPQRVKALLLVAPGGFTPHNFITRAFCRVQGSAWAMSPKLWASLYLRKRSPRRWR